MVLMAIGKIFFSDFGLFYQVPMNSGALYGVTQTIDTFVYRGLMELNDVGMSSAAGLFQSCVGFVLVITANALVRKMNPENDAITIRITGSNDKMVMIPNVIRAKRRKLRSPPNLVFILLRHLQMKTV